MHLKGHLFGQYRFQDLLKRGGMAEVYLANDERLDRQVAIKVIWTDSSHYDDIENAREAVRLFLREARTLAKFDHQHILPIFDSGEGQLPGVSFMYLVMPYRQEGSLSEWLYNYHKMEQLSIWDINRIVQQAASALQYAHDFNIIHQDVKTSNFLIYGKAQFPSQLELQLADFGIARFMTTTSKTQEIRGTPRYMAPEQWDNHPNAATDQYALAIMVYELLTGRPPFMGTTKEQLWHQHCHVLPQPPGEFNPHIPKSLDTVILKALAKHSSDRFASVATFAAAYRQAILNNHHIPLPVTYNRSAAPASLSSLITVERTVPMLPPSESDQQDFPPPDEPPKHRWGKIIVLLGLICVLLLGSGGMLYLTWSYQQKVFTDSTATTSAFTATPGTEHQINSTVPTDTTNVNATNTAFAQETTTANAAAAYATATQTSLMQTAVAKNATATKIASDSTTATAWAGITSGTLIFNDSLQGNNSTSNWDTSPSGPNNNNCSFTAGQYHATVQQTLYPVQPCFAQNTDFANCTYQVTMSILTGDQGGLIFHGNEGAGTFYYFYINIDGSFGLDIFSNNSYQTTLQDGISTAINTGQKRINQLTITATDYTFQLYVNKSLLATVPDTQSSFSHGEIGVAAWSKGKPTDVAFTNAEVWQK